jgi:hypothetical protein
VVARLAAAFDIAALVQFASFGDLLDAFCAERAEIQTFADDPRAWNVRDALAPPSGR